MSARTKLVGAACLSECMDVACGDGGSNMTLKLKHTVETRK